MNFIAIKSKLFNFSLLHGLPSNPRHNTYIYFIGRNLDTRTTMLKGHASQWICNSRITTVFHEFSRFTLYLPVNSRITRNPFQTGPATSNLKTQENQSSNQSAYLLANSGLEGIANSLKVLFFCSKEGLKVWTVLSLFTVNDPCQLPSVNFDMSHYRETLTYVRATLICTIIERAFVH